jgi:transcriptional regulator with GAF, ATPase, and Fis domain
VRGAYTGAVDSQPGHFEMASGGTLFLDEIGELSPRHQAKLLHVLQNRSFSRVGGRVSIDSDARVIAATNQDLDEAIRRGRFRRDLFYRLGVVCLRIPPLRERPDDIVPLARFFATRYALSYGHPDMAEPPAAVIALLRVHPFHGNVREMENLIKRAILLGSWDPILEELDQPAASGDLDRPALPEETRALAAEDSLANEDAGSRIPAHDATVFALSPASTPLKEIARRATEQAERRAIARALATTGWNRRRASRLLGISYRALLYKIRDYPLTPPAKSRSGRAATVYSLRQGSA